MTRSACIRAASFGWMGSCLRGKYLSARKFVYGDKHTHKYKDLIYVDPQTYFEGLALKLLEILLVYDNSLQAREKDSFREDHVVDVIWFYKHSKNTTFNYSHSLGPVCSSINVDKICLTAFKLKHQTEKCPLISYFSFRPLPLPTLVWCHTKLLPETGRIEQPSYKT